MSEGPRRVGIYVRLALVAVIWGSTFIAGRVVAADMTAPTAALWRFVIATAILLVMVRVRDRGLPRLSLAKWMTFVLLGAIGVAGYALCFMYGLQTVTASRGALIVALTPAATLVGGAMFLHEPLTRPRLLGIALALLGVAVELGNGNPLRLFTGPIGVGEVTMFGCVLAWSTYTLLGKRELAEGMSPLAATTLAALTGTAILAIWCVVTGDLKVPAPAWRPWLALVFMGVLGTAVAYLWFYDGVKVIGPARTAVFINLVPVVAITLGVLLLGEKLQMSMVVGAALVVTGVWIINRTPAPGAVSGPVRTG
jgi:drug/metabolite transporter (DMT)-like permease